MSTAKKLGIDLIILFISFYMYNSGRTFTETVGFTFEGTATGLFFGVIFPVCLALPILYLLKYFHIIKNKFTLKSLFAYGFILFVGCIIGEITILHDELKFTNKAINTNEMYSRDRSWPNAGTSLVYVPQKGIHATD